MLVRLWKLSDMMCGKLLKAILPELLASVGRREAVPAEVVLEFLRMSAATMDRRLRKVKAVSPGRGRRRRSSLEEHRREIPLKVDVWPKAYPKARCLSIQITGTILDMGAMALISALKRLRFCGNGGVMITLALGRTLCSGIRGQVAKGFMLCLTTKRRRGRQTTAE